MHKYLIVALAIFTMCFGASTNWQKTIVAGKSTRTIPMALGAELTTTLTGSSSITLSVQATTGRANLPQIMSLSNSGTAISTVDVIVLDNVAIGDILILKTALASEDVVVVEDDSTIFLGAESRTLSDPADELWLRKFSASAVKEVGFYDNN